MPDEKISQLPAVTTVVAADLGVAVASNVTSKITQQQLINALVSFITATVSVGGKITLNPLGNASLANGLFTVDTNGNLKINGTNISINADGSATFANNGMTVGSDGTVTINDIGAGQIAIRLDSSGMLTINSTDGTQPTLNINLMNAVSSLCSLICSPNPNDTSFSASFGADGQGCFVKFGSNFNTFQIRNDANALGNVSVALIALSQLGGGALTPTCGTAQLNGTTPVVVPCATIAADSLVFLTINGPAGTLGCPVEISASRIAATSFSIRSTVALDTSTVAWWVVPNADTF